ncbi:MAG: GNAT family N-acetyltransferase, partial [Chloroflexi bacterium]|nr:GNAT family N-acetyltransferase [Chloroflexota bacterium]
MNFTWVQSPGDFDRLEGEWNDLLAKSASHVPFLRHEYLRIWWDTLGGGEWSKADLAVVTAHEGDRLVGIAPMFSSANKEGEPALLLLGSIEISDYLDVIARPEDLQDFMGGLLSFLDEQESPEWRVLDWYNLQEESPTLPALEKAARSRGWAYSTERVHPTPYIPLPGDWETYLASVDKKQRHEIRRKLRRAASTAVPARWYFVEDGANLESESHAFLDLMAQDPDKAAFLTPKMREQMLKTIYCAFEKGYLQLGFLELDGQKAAGALNFDYLGRIWAYNSGIHHGFEEYSPGWVMLAYMLQWANANQRKEFDLMRGNEEYKYRFGALNRYIVRVKVS